MSAALTPPPTPEPYLQYVELYDEPYHPSDDGDDNVIVDDDYDDDENDAYDGSDEASSSDEDIIPLPSPPAFVSDDVRSEDDMMPPAVQ